MGVIISQSILETEENRKCNGNVEIQKPIKQSEQVEQLRRHTVIEGSFQRKRKFICHKPILPQFYLHAPVAKTSIDLLHRFSYLSECSLTSVTVKLFQHTLFHPRHRTGLWQIRSRNRKCTSDRLTWGPEQLQSGSPHRCSSAGKKSNVKCISKVLVR